MSFALLISLAIKASLAALVFVAGLQTRPGTVMYLVRHPSLFGRSILAVNILMPLIALWTAVMFDLHPAVKLALLALSISPLPPLLPGKLVQAGADASYAVSFLVTSAMLAVVTVPLSINALSMLFDVDFSVTPRLVFGLVGETILLPLMLGAAVRRLAPARAERLVTPINRAAMMLLVVGVLPLFVKAAPAMKGLLGDGTLLAMLALGVVGLAIGHLLGGPVSSDRPVLGMATASRHPALAVAIVHATAPSVAPLVPAAVLLDLIVTACLAGPYLGWAVRSPAPHVAIGQRNPRPTEKLKY